MRLEATLLGNRLFLFTKFQSQTGRIITVDTGQSYLFARTVQARLATSLFVGLPVLLLLAALAGYILMRRALAPVEAMINAAETYTFNDPHKRLPMIGAPSRASRRRWDWRSTACWTGSTAAYSHVSRFSVDAAMNCARRSLSSAANWNWWPPANRLPADVDNAISNALEEMTRLSGMVDSLITLSRMESLWGKQSHAPVDLQALATETIDQMNLMADEKSIALSRPSGPAVVVAGDRDRLKQVLVNLIDNAIKYTPHGGQVSVETGSDGDMGFVSAEDSGIGIDSGPS